jgi:hypothetical protein
MGLFENFGDTLKNIASPIISAVTGSPFTAAVTQASTVSQTKGRPVLENTNMAYNDPFSGGFGSFGSQPAPAPKQSDGFFSNLGTSLGDFGRGVGTFVQDIQPLTSLFGIGGNQGGMAPQAAQSVIRQAPDETSTSGEILGANLGAAGGLMALGRGLARSPGGQAVFGGGLGLAAGALMPAGNGAPRITRKMKSDVRRIYMMAGMDPNATAQILNNLGTYPRMNFNASLVFFILTKRFRNDGPVVTKAAIRKTKTTLRRMKGVVDMYNSVCKPTTRRAPARRAAPKAVQLIKN